MWDLIKRFFTDPRINVPILLMVLGVVVLLLGVGGGITYKQLIFPISDPAARIVAACVGGIIFTLGVWFSMRRPKLLKPSSYGIKIESPSENEQVDAVEDVRGTISKELPDGYTLRVVKIYNNNSLNPASYATVTGLGWKAAACNIGGVPGERRQIAVYLVGPCGAVLLDYFADAARVHNPIRDELRNLTKKEVPWLPNITTRTPDMNECARVSVIRR
jgi:hypothetical protein